MIIPGRNIFLMRIIIPKFPKDWENANVPTTKKITKPFITKGAALNAVIGLVRIAFTKIISKSKFSKAAIRPFIFLTSNNAGLNQNVRTFSGNGYDEMSMAEPALERLKTAALPVANLSKPSADASSIFAYSITDGKMASPTAIIAAEKMIRCAGDTLPPNTYAKPKPTIKNNKICGLIAIVNNPAITIRGILWKGFIRP